MPWRKEVDLVMLTDIPKIPENGKIEIVLKTILRKYPLI